MSTVQKVTVRVRAVKRGSYNGLREPGTATAEFDFETTVDADGKPRLGSWMQLASEPAPAAEPTKEPESPRTFSEMTKAERKTKKGGEPSTLAQGAKDIGADLV